LLPRAVPHRLAPGPPRRLGRSHGAPAEAARRAAARGLRDRHARVPLVHRAVAQALVGCRAKGIGDAGKPRSGGERRVISAATSRRRGLMASFDEIADRLSAPVAQGMRTQGPTRRMTAGPSDDAPILELPDLAGHALAENRRRCEFVVVRDPDVKHQLARANRQGWSIYKRVLRTRSHEDALLESRQWLADHFEDVPVIVV